MLRKIRLVAALLFFTMITLLFLDFTGTVHSWFGWMAKIQFLPAVLALNVGVMIALVLLTLLLGRVYCSVVCPVRCVSRYYFLGFGKGKEESFPLLACFVVVALWGIGGVYRRFGSRGSFIDGIDCSLQCIRPYHF